MPVWTSRRLAAMGLQKRVNQEPGACDPAASKRGNRCRSDRDAILEDPSGTSDGGAGASRQRAGWRASHASSYSIRCLDIRVVSWAVRVLNQAGLRGGTAPDELSGINTHPPDAAQMSELEPIGILEAIAQRAIKADMGHPNDTCGDRDGDGQDSSRNEHGQCADK